MTIKEKSMIFDRYAGQKRAWCIYKKQGNNEMARFVLEDCEFLESLLPNDRDRFNRIHDEVFRAYRMWECFKPLI